MPANRITLVMFIANVKQKIRLLQKEISKAGLPKWLISITSDAQGYPRGS